MPHRGEDDPAGVDDGAVEVEEDDRKAHPRDGSGDYSPRRRSNGVSPGLRGGRLSGFTFSLNRIPSGHERVRNGSPRTQVEARLGDVRPPVDAESGVAAESLDHCERSRRDRSVVPGQGWPTAGRWSSDERSSTDGRPCTCTRRSTSPDRSRRRAYRFPRASSCPCHRPCASTRGSTR